MHLTAGALRCSLSRSAVWLLLLLAVGLQIQAVLPIGAGGLKICPADVIACLLAMLLIHYKLRHQNGRLCASPTLASWVAACGVVLVVSFVIGYQRLGHLSTWALGSKLLGWVVLIGYLLAGLYIGAVLGDKSRRTMARFLIYACIGAGLLSVFLSVVLVYTRLLPQVLTHFPVRGFVDNRNAFIFLLMAAMTLLLAQGWARTPIVGTREREILCGLCGTAIVYTGSRSGLPAAALIFLAALAVGAISLRSAARAMLYGLLCGVSIELARDLILWVMQVLDASKVEKMGILGAGLPPLFVVDSPKLIIHDTTKGSSDNERWGSYLEAFELWRSAPLFGSGLGTALETFLAKHGYPLIIHNTALWLLAETGIVGFAIFIGLGWTVTRSLFPLRTGDDGACFRLAALLMLVMFAIMSLAHEMLYQRVLWLMLGLALAIPRAKADTPCAD